MTEDNNKTILCFDATEYDNFDMCRFRWHMFHHRHIRAKTMESIFEKGTFLHFLLEQYYKKRTIGPVDQSIIEEIAEIGRIESLKYELSLEDVSSHLFQFREYAAFYADEGIVPLHVEEPFTVKIYEDETLEIYISGLPDLIFRYESDKPGVKNVMDHKRMERVYNYSPLRNQFLMYATAMQTDTVIVNKVGFQKTKSRKERFLRTPFIYPQEIIDEWKQDVIDGGKQMLLHYSNNYFPRNRTSCEKWNGCYLQRYCTTRPRGREFLIGTEYLVGQPWDAGRKLEEKEEVK